MYRGRRASGGKHREQSAVTPVRVFTIESPSALDMLEGHSESATLASLCRLLGHPFAAVTVRSRPEFAAALKHLTSLNPDLIPRNERDWPMCVHISAHGGPNGLTVGADHASWGYLAERISSFIAGIRGYPGPVLVIISACCAGEQEITKRFEQIASNSEFTPPAYLFVTVGDEEGVVDWRDAVVAWTIFYHNIGGGVLDERISIKTIMDKIQLVGAGTLKYFRWDDGQRKYNPYRPKVGEHSYAG